MFGQGEDDQPFFYSPIRKKFPIASLGIWIPLTGGG